MTAKNDQKVVIAYPYGHEVAARFMHSLMNVLVWDANHRRRVLGCEGFIAVSSGANITNARNEIVVAFLDRTKADWLLFIDTDMVFDGEEGRAGADLIDRMVEVAHPELRPILGALCFSLNADANLGRLAKPTIYGFSEDNKVVRYEDYPRDQLAAVPATGTGCLLIHRSVLEKMRAANFHPAYPWFMESAFGAVPCGEDITFCVRAASLGIQIMVDTRIKVGHEKPWIVGEEMFIAQKAWRDSQPTPPTFVVMPGKDRHEMTYDIVDQLQGQCDHLFLYDNGSDPGYDLTDHGVDVGLGEVYAATGWPIHRMWNDGLERAEKVAAEMGAPEWNVAILNNDLEIPADFLAQLASGLRRRPDYMAAYPDVYGLKVPEHGVAITTSMGDGASKRSLAGYAFMVKGEQGLRFDEQFEWWYGDDDLERQIEKRGGQVVCCPTTVVHLEPNKSTAESPERLEMAKRDKERFFAKWGSK